MNQSLDVRLPREIAPGIFWLGGCLGGAVKDGRTIHIHLSNYLIMGETTTLLVDTGAPSTWLALQAQLKDTLGSRHLDWVFSSHPEFPHSANLGHILDAFPTAKAIGDIRDYHLYYPRHTDRLVSREVGDSLDLGGGYTFTFVDAVLKDLPSTMWGYESKTQTLFVVDGFGYSHRAAVTPELDEPTHLPGECALTIEEIPGPVEIDNATFILRTALYWSRYVRADKIIGDIRMLIERYPTRVIAPAHGNVITDVASILPIVHSVHAQAYLG